MFRPIIIETKCIDSAMPKEKNMREIRYDLMSDDIEDLLNKWGIEVIAIKINSITIKDDIEL